MKICILKGGWSLIGAMQWCLYNMKAAVGNPAKSEQVSCPCGHQKVAAVLQSRPKCYCDVSFRNVNTILRFQARLKWVMGCI